MEKIRTMLNNIKRNIVNKVTVFKSKIQQKSEEILVNAIPREAAVQKEPGLNAIVITALLILVGIVLVLLLSEGAQELVGNMFDIIDEKMLTMF